MFRRNENRKALRALGAYLASLIILKRLTVVLDPLGSSNVEREARALANQIVELKRKAVTTNLFIGLFKRLQIEVSRATILTKSE